MALRPFSGDNRKVEKLQVRSLRVPPQPCLTLSLEIGKETKF